MSTREPVKPRKRLPRAEREKQILVVAEQVFAANGYQATSMDDIAGKVGLSKPMLYEYFGSKDGLLLACVERARRELLDSTVAAAQGAKTTADVLHDCVAAFFRFTDEHSQTWAVLRNETAVAGVSVNDEIETFRQQQVEFTSGLLRALDIDADPVRLEAYAESITGICERVALWRERKPEISAEQATRYVLDLLTRGLGLGVS